jgi:hypothetical protein
VKPPDPSAPGRQDEARPDADPKREYVKPAFLHERVFETMALACGKVSPVITQCRTNRKNS